MPKELQKQRLEFFDIFKRESQFHSYAQQVKEAIMQNDAPQKANHSKSKWRQLHVEARVGHALQKYKRTQSLSLE